MRASREESEAVDDCDPKADAGIAGGDILSISMLSQQLWLSREAAISLPF